MDMIERVTRAFPSTLKTEQRWASAMASRWDTTLGCRMDAMAETARAAIAAMREPTGAMVDAGHVVIHEQGPPWLCEADRTKPYHVISMPEDVAQRWRQMIDAALQDKSP